VLAGPIGTGKTMLAIALGVEAVRRHKSVLFTRAADLVRDLLEARDGVAAERAAFAAEIRDAIRRIEGIDALAASRRAGLT
jgi:DNA replication protein DnaC